MKEKLEKTEIEVVRFAKENEVITQSPYVIGPIGGDPVIDDGDDN